MPVTLAQAQINAQTDVDFNVIDNLRRYSWLLDQVVFDDTVTPGTGGSSLTYGYTRLVTAAPAGFRAINSEYTPGQATRERKSVDLKPLGGAIQVDRVIARLGNQATTEVRFQMQQLMTSIRTKFCQEVILGDTAIDLDGFDGLSKALVGSVTERQSTAGSWAPSAVDTVDKALTRLDEVDDWLASLVPSHTGSGDQGEAGALPPGRRAIMGNTKSITRFRSLARRATQYTQTEDELGRQIEKYGPWVLEDLGDRLDGGSPIIPINGSGQTDLFAVHFGLDSFHGASPANSPLLQTWLPDFDRAGAVKTGEVEMGPIAMVLKNAKAAGVLRGVTIQ